MMHKMENYGSIYIGKKQRNAGIFYIRNVIDFDLQKNLNALEHETYHASTGSG